MPTSHYYQKLSGDFMSTAPQVPESAPIGFGFLGAQLRPAKSFSVLQVVTRSSSDNAGLAVLGVDLLTTR